MYLALNITIKHFLLTGGHREAIYCNTVLKVEGVMMDEPPPGFNEHIAYSFPVDVSEGGSCALILYILWGEEK